MANTQKHHATGDTFPVLPTDDDHRPVLLSMRFCPFAHRVMLVLEAKRIDHHVVNVNLIRKPDWLFAYSPLGKVPALIVRDSSPQSPAAAASHPVLHESLIVADYLDASRPEQRPLYPADPLLKALDRIWIERFAEIVRQFYRFAVIKADEQPDPSALDALHDGLDAYEQELARRDRRFFGGAEQPGMLDYMIWPWFERFGGLRQLDEARYELSAERFPRLAGWTAQMERDETVRRWWLSADTYAKYILSRQGGTEPNYALLDEV